MRCEFLKNPELNWGLVVPWKILIFFLANAAEKRKHQTAYQAHQQTLQMKKKRPCHPCQAWKCNSKVLNTRETSWHVWFTYIHMNFHEPFWGICWHHWNFDFQDQVLTFIAKPRAAARGNGIFLFQVRPADLRAPRARLKEVGFFFNLKSGTAWASTGINHQVPMKSTQWWKCDGTTPKKVASEGAMIISIHGSSAIYFPGGIHRVDRLQELRWLSGLGDFCWYFSQMVHLDVGHRVRTCSHHGRIGMEAENCMEIVQLLSFSTTFGKPACLIAFSFSHFYLKHRFWWCKDSFQLVFNKQIFHDLPAVFGFHVQCCKLTPCFWRS